MAQTLNLFLDQGTTFSANITVNDSSGTVRDISDYTARSQFRRSYLSANSNSFTATIETGTDGNVRLQMSAADSSNVVAARYLYDVEIVSNTTSAVERIIEGIVVVTPEVTR